MRNVLVSVAEDGCLDVRSGAVGQTYWPEAAPPLSSGVFHTSDLAEISFGLVYLRGRVTDQINVAGRKVSPEGIEKVLATHPAVRECLVFGAPVENGDRSEIVVACFVPREPIAGDALRRFLLDKLPTWQVPREWWQVDSLSVNERGKLSRAEWRKRFVELTAAGDNMP
jgi:acyl-CoA synthetase (AMP-forming)/AMP-acid ligase II